MSQQTHATGYGALTPLLKKTGLSEKEVAVYLALLALKEARATDIAKAAKQTRSHTYLILKDLAEKGLVAKVERGKILYFLAEPPQRLLSFLQERERNLKETEKLLQSALPAFEAITTQLAGKPRVTLLTGVEGVKQVYKDVLTQEIVGIFNPQVMYDAFGCNIVTKIFGENVKLHGRDLFTNNTAGRQFASEITQHKDYEVRLLPKNVTLNTDTLVYGDSVALFAYDDEMTIVRIENTNLANTFREWFEMLWKASKKLKR